MFSTSCSGNYFFSRDRYELKTKVYFDLFDTVIYVYNFSNETEDEFSKNCNDIFNILNEYHILFDIYNEYPEINNLCSLNKNAGRKAIEVDKKLIDFLLYAENLYDLTNGEMNIMMGSILDLWHKCRENNLSNRSNGNLPSKEELEEANKHISFDALKIDIQNNTLEITDIDASVDVGAVGKGYAVEMVAKHLEKNGVTGYALNVGGNIRIIGSKPDGNGWNTGIQNPMDSSKSSANLELSDTSCVTSGDYERFFVVGDKKYHHIIDKDTLMPAEFFSSVTVITKDSGLADALSTAFFCMSYQEGVALLGDLENVDVMWIDKNGEIFYTDGFEKYFTEEFD